MKIGIDIGGTTIGAGLVAEGGRVVRRTDGASCPQGAALEETLDLLSARIEALLTPEVTGIGIGVPSVVDPERGIVYDTANIPSWKEVPLKAFLEDRFGVPVQVDNDANCFALGAATQLGAGKEILVAVTLGTGVGVGIVTGGRLLRGRCCGAGELCCLPYRNSVIEDYTSSKFFSAHGTTAFEAAQALSGGSPRLSAAGAQALFDAFGTHLGWLTAAVLYAYDPHWVVFGGGIARSFDHFEPALRRALSDRFAYPGNLSGLRLESLTDPDTALIGAASL